ncbi:hypothetical protein PG990_015483 [Apiospora arundinis]
MVQFNGPNGKVTVAYLRQGGLNPPAEPPSESFAGKTVAITGCASGIGYEAAMRIAELKPKKLILGARTAEKAERVNQFAATIRQTTQTLDCLLLSAGVALPTRETAEDGWPTTFKVNVLAPTLLAIELLPLLRATPGSVLEFVNSISYCNVTSQDVAPLLDDPAMSTLAYFNGPERWTTQRAYYEAKLMLMFVLDGLVEAIGDDQGTVRGNPAAGPIVLACCPGQCKTSLYREFPAGVRWFMAIFNAVIARTAEQGSRTLVTGLLQGREANGRMWVNDHYDDWSPGITEAEWKSLQQRVWSEVKELLRGYKPDLDS